MYGRASVRFAGGAEEFHAVRECTASGRVGVRHRASRAIAPRACACAAPRPFAASRH